MYSWQVDELLKNNNYVINKNDYNSIVYSSQIRHIKYDPFSDDFIINTDDGYSWRFTVDKGE